MSMVSIGISLGHDSGLAIIDGNELIYAVNEERLTRIKTFSGIPIRSIESVPTELWKDSQIYLDGKKIVPHGRADVYKFESEFSKLAILAQKTKAANILLGTKPGVRILQNVMGAVSTQKRENQHKIIRKLTGSSRIYRVEHHDAHIYSVIRQGIFTGDINAGTFFTLDAMGEGICSKFGLFGSNGIKILDWQPALASPATLYAYITKVIGFTPLKHEGKLTGLSARGNPHEVKQILEQFYSFENGRFMVRKLGYGTEAIKKLQNKLSGISKEDISAGLQDLFEELVISYLNHKNRKGINLENLFCAGGAFANVKLNKRIAQLPYVSRLRIAPNMGDGGLALGLAANSINTPIVYSNLFLGTKITNTLPKEFNLKQIETSDTSHFLANALLNKKFIAIANDKMEWGPRALGNRSILFSADSKETTTLLNNKLSRSEFMPFAPICCYEKAPKYFHFDTHIDDYLHMTIACQVKQITKREYPGITHIDCSARPQILKKEDNPFVHKLLMRTGELGGKDIFVNTSFNLHEEPIVASTTEAITSFKKANLDYLVLNYKIYEQY